MSKLRECPFCGGTELRRYSRGHDSMGPHIPPREWECVKCNAIGPIAPSQYRSGVMWNSRPIEDTLRAQVKVLREAAKSALNEIEKHYYFEVKQILQDALSATEHAE